MSINSHCLMHACLLLKTSYLLKKMKEIHIHVYFKPTLNHPSDTDIKEISASLRSSLIFSFLLNDASFALVETWFGVAAPTFCPIFQTFSLCLATLKLCTHFLYTFSEVLLTHQKNNIFNFLISTDVYHHNCK